MTVENAWSGLIAAIASAQATEDLSDHAADELTKRADELLDAYREGDPEKLGEALTHLDEELAKAVEDEEISPTAADSIDSAILDWAAALESEGAGALEVVPTEAATGRDGRDGRGPWERGQGRVTAVRRSQRPRRGLAVLCREVGDTGG